MAVPLLIGLAVAGTAVKAVGQVKAGNAAKKAGEAEQAAAESSAQLDEYNAQVADLQATDATDRGTQAENKFRTSVRGLFGSQRAGAAGANIDVTSGSVADVQADAAYLGELDALTIRNNAAREAWGFKVQAGDLRQRAVIARKTGVADAAAGRERQTAANIEAAGTLLGGGYSLVEAKYGFGKKGV